MKKISIINQKGGVGKTATAVNLAYNLTTMGKKVCLIDFDPQANATAHCGIEIKSSEPSIFNFLSFPESTSCAFPTVAKRSHGFHVIPSKGSLVRASHDGPEAPRILKTTIENSRSLQQFDFIIIDALNSPGFLNDNAICASDLIVIPTDCKYLGVESVKKVIHNLEVAKNNVVGVKANILGILPTFYNSCKRESNRSLDVLKTRYENMVFEPIRDNTQLAEAPHDGQPIEIYNPKCNGAIDYRKFTRSFLEKERVF